MIYLQLYISFFQIGLFSFGGGYAALPLIQEQVVTMNHWLSMQAFADVVTISQMTPGPIAINAATFVGIQMGGTLGAVIATIGCVTPSVVISLFLAYVYYKYKNLSIVKGIMGGLRPAVVALITAAGISLTILAFFGQKSLTITNLDLIAVLLFMSGFFILRKWKINPLLIMVAAGIIGGVLYSVVP